MPKSFSTNIIGRPSEEGLSRSTTGGSAISVPESEPIPQPAHAHYTFKEKVEAFFHHNKAKAEAKV
ncbi:MAG: hypothetical protein CYPHOPRED_000178 [Cyphobasidiales sp. Tagirdzhanova-0007]|nr:MAG: hypothetical protein CYPHOPRED_000178 [Cyphobasidiales sp. Tagirdzhanova-0007]